MRELDMSPGEQTCRESDVSIARKLVRCGGSKVGMIVIRCPKTGQEVSTGIEIEPENFQLLPPVAGRVQCPLCGEEHSWLPSAAQVKDVEFRAIDQVRRSDPSSPDA
jgi:hypothetical protein